MGKLIYYHFYQLIVSNDKKSISGINTHLSVFLLFLKKNVRQKSNTSTSYCVCKYCVYQEFANNYMEDDFQRHPDAFDLVMTDLVNSLGSRNRSL